MLRYFSEDKTSNYGRQRCFGALGWGLFSVLAGFMVDLFSDGAAKKNYLPVFCLSIIMLTVDFAVSLNIKVSLTYFTIYLGGFCKKYDNGIFDF